MEVIGMMLVRNEQDRYLKSVLEQMWSVCNRLIVLDDASDDDTPVICAEYADLVVISHQSYWGIDELKQRKKLWEIATQHARAGDWILCMDADETITNINLLPDLITYAEQQGINSIGFPLYDMWDETHYRDDKYWNAHKRSWVMCVKYFSKKKYVWREQALHCGRFPVNTNYDKIAGHKRMVIQHWGWSRAPDREAKYKRYMDADPKGKNGLIQQYQSILDKNPVLKEFCL
jgi:glycosyltransferase involved in cell wall biosynthesis